MNKQKIFEAVIGHLATQGKRSYGVNPNSGIGEMCLYRGPGGLKCAAGFLISDDEYKLEMEGSAFLDVVYDFEIKDWRFKYETLISSLQSLHDNNETWRSKEAFIREVKQFAVHHKLKTSLLKGLTINLP